ncbi:MAG: hypothetical protein LW625_05190 [Planctomycetaceae bacterium]|jgi:hypothetical protein|nr:hypothetical protein [Planctomycetaceae bacterium]
MNSPELLRREELIEQASLDALGLLDAFEAAHYAKSFHAAPASVQEEIRQLQAEIATDASLLSDEEPPAGLRGRVMGAVMDSIEHETRELQPIATIGSRARRVAATGATATAADIAGVVRDERMHLQYRSMQRSVAVWRAASVALAASLLGSFLWLNVITHDAMSIAQLAQGQATQAQLIEMLGSDYATFSTDKTMRIRSLAALAGEPGAAILYCDPKNGDGYLVGFGLAQVGTYTIRSIADDGTTITLGQVIGGSRVTATRLARVDSTRLAHSRIEVVDDTGRPILLAERT